MIENSAAEIEKSLGIETVILESTDYCLDEIKDGSKELEELLMMYGCAIREVRTRLETLNDEFKVRRSHNPIEYLKYRVKKPASIREKLVRRGFPVTLESIQKNLNDVAGVRVVCCYVQDIYDVANMLTSQADVKLIETKDYIKHPKPNGYRSLHLIVEVPVFLSDGFRPMRVEVQIRTIAMDFWASLEHQLNYKTEGHVSPQIIAELKDCSDVIANTDIRMQNIYNTLY